MGRFLWNFLIGQFLLFNDDPSGGGNPDPAPADGGGSDPNNILGADDPAPNEGNPLGDAGGKPTNQINEQMKAFWGDLADKIEWPEGTPDEVKLAPAIKPFIDKEGKLRTAELAKSYYHTKKKMGDKGVHVPSENSPQEEWDEYFKKAGWSPEIEGYELKVSDELGLSEEQVNKYKELFHENRIPQKQAQSLIEKLGSMGKESFEAETQTLKQEIEENVNNLKKEWGQAFDGRVAQAKKVLKEFGNEDLSTMLKEDAYLGSHPAILKFLNDLGEKMFGEDGMPGAGMRDMALSPAEAQQEINRIYGDSDDAYHKPQHPAHKDRVAHVQKLFQYKNAR